MRLLLGKTVQTLLLGLALIALGGSVRPACEHSGVPDSVFWARKLGWHCCADVVVLGDSRAFRGLSPAAMAEELPGLRVLNYAFSANGYTPEYLAAAAQVLDPASRTRALVICVTPRTLTPSALSSNGFRDLTRRQPAELWLAAHGGRLPDLLAPYEFPDILAALRGGKRKVVYENEYQPDGSIASTRDPEDQTLQLADYEAIFRAGPANPAAAEALLKQVRAWRQAGILVYGLRPPVGAEMYELEQRLSGFDALHFPRRFAGAGAVWLELDPLKYHTYDGSHLRADSADQLSRDVACRILADLAGDDYTPALATETMSHTPSASAAGATR
jgi:hypothetical protein